MQEVDWDLVQFKYEALGQSIADLAKEHQVPEAVLTYAVKEQKWERIPLEELSSKKAEYLSPRYFALEATLLSKANQMAAMLDIEKPTSANSLKTLVQVLKDLISCNPELAPEGSTVQKWEVEIVDSPKAQGAAKTGTVSDKEEKV